VVILGRGGAGKSTLATRLGHVTGLPVVELDELFWPPGLVAPTHAEWAERQRELIGRPGWIMDGDLGPYDVLAPRLAAADTVLILNYSLVRCGWQAMRRSRERWDFWRWVLMYRRRSLPAIRRTPTTATVHVFRDPKQTEAFARTAQAR
jgi:adenylate kinase family enzyme